MTSKSSSRLDNFLTEFVTEKKAVIRSKSLRIPEIIVNACLVTGVLGYHLVYELNFFVERNDLSPDVRPNLYPTFRNWWGCTLADGSCRYDVPEPDTLEYCTEKQTNSVWDKDQIQFIRKSALINCSKFNMAEDYQTKSGQLWITTYEELVKEGKDSHGSWQQVAHVAGTRLISGAEQIVIFHGTLPGRLGVEATTLGHMQGFLKYANETDVQVRRIPFAREGKWLNAGARLAMLKYDWTSQYPEDAVSGNDPMPEFFYNSTGCFQVSLGLVGDPSQVTPEYDGKAYQSSLY